jgi:hypothetical protein
MKLNGAKRNAYKRFVGKPKGKGPLEITRSGWVDYIKTNLREVAWIDLSQDRDQWRALVNTVMNLRVP